MTADPPGSSAFVQQYARACLEALPATRKAGRAHAPSADEIVSLQTMRPMRRTVQTLDDSCNQLLFRRCAVRLRIQSCFELLSRVRMCMRAYGFVILKPSRFFSPHSAVCACVCLTIALKIREYVLRVCVCASVRSQGCSLKITA